jgi:imidazolonepropionase-like amidohydrolase
VVAPGAYADLLVVDGDPLADIGVLADPETRMVGIMKAGSFVKRAF